MFGGLLAVRLERALGAVPTEDVGEHGPHAPLRLGRNGPSRPARVTRSTESAGVLQRGAEHLM
jgi:hypothetical protein